MRVARLGEEQRGSGQIVDVQPAPELMSTLDRRGTDILGSFRLTRLSPAVGTLRNLFLRSSTPCFPCVLSFEDNAKE